MRMANRIFDDPDSDPEQDPYGSVSGGVDHPGLLLLVHPRPLIIAAAVKDFVPIEGARRTFREIASVYRRFGGGDRVALVEGVHEHRFSDENQDAVFAFLDRFNGLPVTHGFDSFTPLTSETLRCTASGQVRVDVEGDRPLTEIIREYYRVLSHPAGNGPAGALPRQPVPRDRPLAGGAVDRRRAAPRRSRGNRSGRPRWAARPSIDTYCITAEDCSCRSCTCGRPPLTARDRAPWCWMSAWTERRAPATGRGSRPASMRAWTSSRSTCAARASCACGTAPPETTPRWPRRTRAGPTRTRCPACWPTTSTTRCSPAGRTSWR